MTDPVEERRIKVLSPAFVVRSSSGAERTVIDLRYPNSFMAQRTCRYETLADVAQVLRPADAMLVWDVADAYHHFLLRPEDALFLALELDGRIFISLTMPFGLWVAPYTWTKVCGPVVQCLRGKGFRMIAYVDDFGGALPAKRGQPAFENRGDRRVPHGRAPRPTPRAAGPPQQGRADRADGHPSSWLCSRLEAPPVPPAPGPRHRRRADGVRHLSLGNLPPPARQVLPIAFVFEQGGQDAFERADRPLPPRRPLRGAQRWRET